LSRISRRLYGFLMKALSTHYDVRGHTGGMRTFEMDNATVSVLVVIIAATVLVWTPVYVSFVCAIGGALCWCFWLERRSWSDGPAGFEEVRSAVVLGERETSAVNDSLISPVIH
jgi:hypothetical protein